MADVPRHTTRQIAELVAAGMDPDAELVSAQYCDAYEKRIAELEAEAVTAMQRIDTLASRCEFQKEQIADLVVERDSARAELARVKVESLLVVEMANDEFARCMTYHIVDGKYVRLERWEDGE